VIALERALRHEPPDVDIDDEIARLLGD